MGLSPRDINKLTFAEFEAMVRGFARFHGAKESGEAPSSDDFYADLAEEMAKGQQ